LRGHVVLHREACTRGGRYAGRISQALDDWYLATADQI
jgi:hypothetical protein